MNAITEDDVRALRQQKDLIAFMKDAQRNARTSFAHRRGLVLRHPDLAVKLTEQPLNFATPEHWTGFIPPATVCTGAINTTPMRPALLALIAEAELRHAQPRRAAA